VRSARCSTCATPACPTACCPPACDTRRPAAPTPSSTAACCFFACARYGDAARLLDVMASSGTRLLSARHRGPMKADLAALRAARASGELAAKQRQQEAEEAATAAAAAGETVEGRAAREAAAAAAAAERAGQQEALKRKREEKRAYVTCYVCDCVEVLLRGSASACNCNCSCNCNCANVGLRGRVLLRRAGRRRLFRPFTRLPAYPPGRLQVPQAEAAARPTSARQRTAGHFAEGRAASTLRQGRGHADTAATRRR
jgi:hypothetical protein